MDCDVDTLSFQTCLLLKRTEDPNTAAFPLPLSISFSMGVCPDAVTANRQHNNTCVFVSLSCCRKRNWDIVYYIMYTSGGSPLTYELSGCALTFPVFSPSRAGQFHRGVWVSTESVGLSEAVQCPADRSHSPLLLGQSAVW